MSIQKVQYSHDLRSFLVEWLYYCAILKEYCTKSKSNCTFCAVPTLKKPWLYRNSENLTV